MTHRRNTLLAFALVLAGATACAAPSEEGMLEPLSAPDVDLDAAQPIDAELAEPWLDLALEPVVAGVDDTK